MTARARLPFAGPTLAADALGWITADQMREVDRVMIEDLRIDLVRMMGTRVATSRS